MFEASLKIEIFVICSVLLTFNGKASFKCLSVKIVLILIPFHL